MDRPAHADTLFHLEPADPLSSDVLTHPNNAPFVSLSSAGNLGLEVGYHVSRLPRGGQVLAQLGRTADLVVNDMRISATHIAFKVHPVSHAILVYIVASNHGSVTVTPNVLRTDVNFRQFVLLPGEEYTISIQARAGLCNFHVRWRSSPSVIAQAIDAGFRAAEERAKIAQVNNTEVDDNYDAVSWYNTRLSSTRLESGVRIMRLGKKLGNGAFGTVYKAVDLDSGHFVAAKVVEPANERQFSTLHREIQTLGRVHHPHIIEFLGHTGWPDKWIEGIEITFYMPLKTGSLQRLIPLRQANQRPIVEKVTHEMLSALDYLAFNHLCHRDVKPLNILFDTTGDGAFRFFLSDFGFATHEDNATTFCGTNVFLAPELHTDLASRHYLQSSKLDMWSLLVTCLILMPEANCDPRALRTKPEWELRVYIRETTMRVLPGLEPMARVDPETRASAAQMLVQLFGAKGLSTPRASIKPIPEYFAPAVTAAQAQATLLPRPDVGVYWPTWARSALDLRRQKPSIFPLAYGTPIPRIPLRTFPEATQDPQIVPNFQNLVTAQQPAGGSARQTPTVLQTPRREARPPTRASARLQNKIRARTMRQQEPPAPPR